MADCATNSVKRTGSKNLRLAPHLTSTAIEAVRTDHEEDFPGLTLPGSEVVNQAEVEEAWDRARGMEVSDETQLKE